MPTREYSIARRAAQRLTALDPRLPEHVDRAILAAEAGEPPKRFFDLAVGIALGALILQIAQFGWQLYQDLKKDKAPPPGALARHIRVRTMQMDLPPTVTPQQLGQVIDAVAKEITAADDLPGA